MNLDNLLKIRKFGLKITIFVSLCNFCIATGQTTQEEKLTILFTGDIMGHEEQIWAAENREMHSYNYDEVFKYIKPVISEADVAIGNLEVTLAGPPYTGYPAFSSPDQLAVACKNAGFDYLANANNHSADRGKRGVINTINKLDSLGIPHTGTFLNSAARDSLSPLIINRKGKSIALLNYTYGTNGIQVAGPVIINMLDKELISADIRKAQEKKADVIILFLHWGNEYDTIPSKTQTDLAEFFFTKGVDIIIGSHPHVIQKMVWIKNAENGKDKLVAYSLGNFVSNQRKPKTDGGTMIRIELTWNGQTFKISNSGYYLSWVYTPMVNYRRMFYILPCSQYENREELFSNHDDYLKMKRFIKGSRNLLYKQNVGIHEYIFNGNSWLLNN
jgi:poly-gamma-glutamate capsule biosynthesis protein CapA/YwtB (metallophosphatase superfamily)